MAKKRDRIQPEAKIDRYFHVVLNMADDDLNPYQYRLLGHYIRVGECWESVRTTAKNTKMSVGMVVRARNELAAMGYINAESRADDTYLITVNDRMAENVARYSRGGRCEPSQRSASFATQNSNARQSGAELNGAQSAITSESRLTQSLVNLLNASLSGGSKNEEPAKSAEERAKLYTTLFQSMREEGLTAITFNGYVIDATKESITPASSVHRVNTDVHMVNTAVHMVNQRKNTVEERTKEEIKRSPAPTATGVGDENSPSSLNNGKPAGAPPTPPVPPPPAPPIFRAIAKWAFTLADDNVIDGIWNSDPRTAKRIKIVSAWLAKKYNVKDVAGDAAESVVARMRECQAWKKNDAEYKKLSVPKDGTKFGEMWAKFESSQAALGRQSDGEDATGAVSTGLGEALRRKAAGQ